MCGHWRWSRFSSFQLEDVLGSRSHALQRMSFRSYPKFELIVAEVNTSSKTSMLLSRWRDLAASELAILLMVPFRGSRSLRNRSFIVPLFSRNQFWMISREFYSKNPTKQQDVPVKSPPSKGPSFRIARVYVDGDGREAIGIAPIYNVFGRKMISIRMNTGALARWSAARTMLLSIVAEHGLAGSVSQIPCMLGFKNAVVCLRVEQWKTNDRWTCGKLGPAKEVHRILDAVIKTRKNKWIWTAIFTCTNQSEKVDTGNFDWQKRAESGNRTFARISTRAPKKSRCS